MKALGLWIIIISSLWIADMDWKASFDIMTAMFLSFLAVGCAIFYWKETL